VGKSTVVASLGIAAAHEGQRPLIVELGHRASMAGIFSGATIDHQPRPIACDGRLWAMNLEHDEALFDYIVAQLKIRRLARAIARNASLRGLFRAAPAVREIITLAKLAALAEEVDSEGRRRWQPIIVDLDATGHALMLLELPQLLRELVKSGPLARVTRSICALIEDPERTSLSLVTLARAVPVQETIELYQQLQGRHGIAVDALVVNQIPAVVTPPKLARWVDLAEEKARALVQDGADRLRADLRLVRRIERSRAQAQAQLRRLRGELEGAPQVELPQLEDGVQGPADLLRLGELLRSGLRRSTGLGLHREDRR